MVGLVPLPDDRDLAAALLQMPVKAVGGDIQNAVLEPSDRDRQVEAGILDDGEWLDPVNPLSLLPPERIRIGDRFGIHFAIA